MIKNKKQITANTNIKKNSDMLYKYNRIKKEKTVLTIIILILLALVVCLTVLNTLISNNYNQIKLDYKNLYNLYNEKTILLKDKQEVIEDNSVSSTQINSSSKSTEQASSLARTGANR